MATKLYEMRLFRQGERVRTAVPYVADIDLRAADTLSLVLSRHLAGAAQRAGAHPADIHLYDLRLHETSDDRKGFGDPVLTWALPQAV